MQRLADTCDAIGGTPRRSEKVRLLAEYLAGAGVEDAAAAALLLSGRVFAAHEETTLQVGGALLWRVIGEAAGVTDTTLAAAYRRHGDLGAAAEEVLPARRGGAPPLALVGAQLRRVAAARGPATKAALVRELLEQAAPREAKYLVKIMTGDLRIGLRESLVEEAIAKAYGAPIAAVQRADMLLGDVAETVRLAAAGRLGEARMRLMHPIGFMLASPAEDAAEAALSFPAAQVEDKYDGIRAQAHVGHDEVKLFSRTLDDVTGAFPELTAPLAALPAGVILDGEIVAWSEQADDGTGRALPFAALQRRLGRKSVSTALLREVPVAYVAFDVLYAGGRLLIDEPLRARAAALHALLAAPARTPSRRAVEPSGQLAFPGLVAPAPRAPGPHGRVIRAAVRRAASAAELEALFEDALGRGNEGLMVKDLDGVYTPGRRGRLWLKLKRELATLDVVVTAVEYGHGKRHEVLSDYTFAVRDGERLVNVGKAYSGLTDAEIAGMTDWFLGHTAADHGFLREVEPRIVLEVAFNAVMRSDRHESGYTLRFPRILRLRPDKLPSEIDGIERVRALFDQQHARRPR